MKNDSSPGRGITFKTIRIIILLVVLCLVALDAWQTKHRSTDWDQSLWVAIYPINGDRSTQSADYIHALKEEDFDTIEVFMSQEARRFQLQIQNPITIKLAPQIKKLPPEAPTDGSLLNVVWWSLKLRYWAHISDTFEGPPPDIRIFAIFFDPKTHSVMHHSLGLEKGLIGIANLFAASRQAEQNNIVIAHEILHTVGASDKYDIATQKPIYPDGYAEPKKNPLFPQERAEIMAGRIPKSKTESILPEGLFRVIIGEKTAEEIHWSPKRIPDQ